MLRWLYSSAPRVRRMNGFFRNLRNVENPIGDGVERVLIL